MFRQKEGSFIAYFLPVLYLDKRQSLS